MSHDDFETEPIPGLPAHLPEGEEILWQGAPARARVARHVFKTRWITAYFAGLALWRLITGLYDGKATADITGGVVMALILGLLVLGVFHFMAWLIARTTIYTLTNKRVVMRFGMALPMTFNLPYTQIEGADVLSLGDKAGTIALRLADHTRISWAILWPHARPFHLKHPQPSLRALADVETPARLLVEGLQAAHGIEGKPAPAPQATTEPARQAVRVKGLQPKTA